MSSEAVAAPGDSLEPIKNVTAVEGEIEAKVARLREQVKTQLEALHRESEALLLQARADAEREREASLTQTRAQADREAEQILAEGTDRSAAIRGRSPSELAGKREGILTAILAEFRAPGKRPA